MFRRDLAGALRDAGAVRVPGEGALGALVAALFGTLQPPYFAPREFEALHRALAELEAARGPGAAALRGALAREPGAEAGEAGGAGEAGEAGEAGAAGDGAGAAPGEGVEAEEAEEGQRWSGGESDEGGDPDAPAPGLRVADVRALLDEALQADGGGATRRAWRAPLSSGQRWSESWPPSAPDRMTPTRRSSPRPWQTRSRPSSCPPHPAPPGTGRPAGSGGTGRRARSPGSSARGFSLPLSLSQGRGGDTA